MPGLQNASATLDYLGTIGSSDRGDTVNLSNTAKVLVELGENLIKKASDNLQSKGHVATGGTIASMRIINIDVKTVVMSLDIEILSSYKFLDQGVRGTVTGSGKYSFKTPYPSKKMATAILKWARKRGRSGKIKYTAKSVNEAKSKKIHKIVSASDNLKGMAYGMATNIKKHGIEKTLFFTKAVKDTRELQKTKLGQAFKLDIIQQLN